MIRKIILLLLLPNLMLAQNIEKLKTFGFENLQERYLKDTYTLFYEDNLYRFSANWLLIWLARDETRLPKKRLKTTINFQYY